MLIGGRNEIKNGLETVYDSADIVELPGWSPKTPVRGDQILVDNQEARSTNTVAKNTDNVNLDNLKAEARKYDGVEEFLQAKADEGGKHSEHSKQDIASIAPYDGDVSLKSVHLRSNKQIQKDIKNNPPIGAVQGVPGRSAEPSIASPRTRQSAVSDLRNNSTVAKTPMMSI